MDRGRRSGRRAGGEGGRRRDNPRGCRAAPPHGRNRDRAHGPPRAHRNDGRKCSYRGSRSTLRSHVRRHDLRAGGGGDHRANSLRGHCGARRGVRSPSHADGHGRHGSGQSKWSWCIILSVSKIRGHRCAALGRVVDSVTDHGSTCSSASMPADSTSLPLRQSIDREDLAAACSMQVPCSSRATGR